MHYKTLVFSNFILNISYIVYLFISLNEEGLEFESRDMIQECFPYEDELSLLTVISEKLGYSWSLSWMCS